jgi:hypothetical protein
MAKRQKLRIRINKRMIFEKNVAVGADIFGSEIYIWMRGLVHCENTINVRMMQHEQRLERAILERPHVSLRRFTVPPTTNYAVDPPVCFFHGVREIVHVIAPKRAVNVVV